MGYGNQQQAARVSAARLASISGSAAPVAASTSGNAAPIARVSHEPDLSRMRARGIEETPEERKRRLAAKTVNFTASFIARLLLMAALAKFGYDAYEMTGVRHRGAAFGLFAMLADFGRVALKAMEPGTK